MAAARTEIRRAQVTDAAEMARLAGELGYPMSSAEMTRRLAVLLPNERHYVAVVANGNRLFGWMHVEHRFSLEGGDRAELMGLVVDSTARRQGLGRGLLDVAENWTLARGVSSLTVRSNAARELSHPFYESVGYSRSKTQHVYTKVVKAGKRVPSLQQEFPGAVPEVPVNDIALAAEYYENRLGFKKDWGNDDGGIAQVSRGNCRIFLTNRAFRESLGNAAPVLVWLNLDSKREVDELYEAWNRCDARILFKPESKPWKLHEFIAADLDGNLFRVFYDFAWEVGGREP